MKVFETFDQQVHQSGDCVLAIGNFDGVHQGHVALLKTAQKKAEELDKKLAVLTFEPHPRRLFRPDESPNRITPPALKAERLREFGVDVLFSLTFDWDFASQPAEVFIQKVLKDGLSAAHIVVGHDFKFGQLRKGEPADIEAAGIGVTVLDQQSDNAGQVFSSSRVREALRAGRLNEANAVLGWEWQIWGEVVKGDQRGRELGFPTANFALNEIVHPRYGVYAAQVQIEGESEWYGAATNIGIRPMFESKVALVETFIFDFSCEIYGQTLKVRPVQFLRGEAKFDSLDDLIKQMDQDCLQAKEILKAR